MRMYAGRPARASGRVTFDMPIRILLDGQAGGRAFYIEGGADGWTITPIDLACAADDAGRVHHHLGGAGECQIDSADGDKIIYTHHLTKFGAALPVGAALPPAVHTCSVSLDMPRLVMKDVRPGGLSDPVRQTVIKWGSAPFANVDLAATMWRAGPSQGTDAPAPLPASATEVSMTAACGPYTALANGTAVAHDREGGGGGGGGGESPLWFMLNLTSHGDMRGGMLVQEVTYQATCRVPQYGRPRRRAPKHPLAGAARIFGAAGLQAASDGPPVAQCAPPPQHVVDLARAQRGRRGRPADDRANGTVHGSRHHRRRRPLAHCHCRYRRPTAARRAPSPPPAARSRPDRWPRR